jgi:hypothetical protein
MLERIGAEHHRALRTILYSCWLYSTTSMGSVRFDRFAECSSSPCVVSSPARAPQQAACFTRIAATDGRARNGRRAPIPKAASGCARSRRHESALEGSGLGH